MEVDVKDLIDELKNYIEENEDSLTEDDKYMFAVIIAVLKQADSSEQNSQKLIYEGDGYYNGELVYDTAICPRCNRHFDINDEEEYGYCPSCGQKLDWSIDDEDDK